MVTLDTLSTKQRIVLLQELLKKYTDEENELSLNQICEKFLDEYNIQIGKSTFRDDLKELEDSMLFDITVNHEKEGVEKYFSHQNRLFEIYELRLLVDAVSSAKFISNKETEKLISKIEQLASVYQAKQLKNRLILSESVKNEDKQIKYTIYKLHTAVAKNKIIHFKYGRYNLNKEFQLSHDGQVYPVKPYGLVWNNDYYYLIGEYIPEGDIRHYRVDRMREVESSHETFTPNPDFNITKHTEKLFNMYSGNESLIEIEFDNDLINVVIDRFGRGINIRPAGEKSFRISTQATISKGLIRWLLTWGSDAKVITPRLLIEEMKKESERLFHIYHLHQKSFPALS